MRFLSKISLRLLGLDNVKPILSLQCDTGSGNEVFGHAWNKEHSAEAYTERVVAQVLVSLDSAGDDVVEVDSGVLLELLIVVVVGNEHGNNVGAGIVDNGVVVDALACQDFLEFEHEVELVVFLGVFVDVFDATWHF